MIDKLTREEACRLVEDSLERVYKTLMYVRAKLDMYKPDKVFDFEYSARDHMEVKAKVDHANLLCNINYYGAYLKGARAMYRALLNKGFLDVPDVNKKANEERITNKAMLDLYMADSRNMEWLLTEVPQGVQLVTSYERNKKGKAVKAQSKFYKKEIIRKEI